MREVSSQCFSILVDIATCRKIYKSRTQACNVEEDIPAMHERLPLKVDVSSGYVRMVELTETKAKQRDKATQERRREKHATNKRT